MVGREPRRSNAIDGSERRDSLTFPLSLLGRTNEVIEQAPPQRVVAARLQFNTPGRMAALGHLRPSRRTDEDGRSAFDSGRSDLFGAEKDMAPQLSRAGVRPAAELNKSLGRQVANEPK